MSRPGVLVIPRRCADGVGQEIAVTVDGDVVAIKPLSDLEALSLAHRLADLALPRLCRAEGGAGGT